LGPGGLPDAGASCVGPSCKVPVKANVLVIVEHLHASFVCMMAGRGRETVLREASKCEGGCLGVRPRGDAWGCS